MSSISDLPEEFEVLLNRGHTIKVLSVKDDIVECELA